MTEAQFQAMVLTLARSMGVVAYHTHDSRRSQPGFPDLVLVGERGILFRELKTDVGRVSPDQRFWLEALSAAGQDARVWRPKDDWPAAVQNELLRLGRCRSERPLPSQDSLRKHLAKKSFGTPN